MRDPIVASPSDLDSLPDRPAVFLLWAGNEKDDAKPYLARTALLRRRLKRLLSERNQERTSRVLNLHCVVERVEYWLTGSQIESSLVYLELSQRYFPEDWQRITRLRSPAFLRLTLDNPFPRTMVTTRLGRGLFFGPFPSRAAAERFDGELLDLFQLRRCEENLQPSPDHPGCIYGEMNKCLRPCQDVVTIDEYRTEATRVEQFLRTNGASLREAAEQSRDRASTDMQFEEAERLHQRVERIAQVQAAAGDLPRTLDRLAGVAVLPSSVPQCIDLWFLIGGCWQEPLRLSLTEESGAGSSLDHRLRDLVGVLKPQGQPTVEHLAILSRWYGSSWRDGEWIDIEWNPSEYTKIPYRRIVNAIARVSKPPAKIEDK
jgi:excinuclease ABC subunit C